MEKVHFVFTLEVILSRTSNQSLLGPDGRLGTAAARQPAGAQVCNSVSQVVQPRLPISMYGALDIQNIPDIPNNPDIPNIPDIPVVEIFCIGPVFNQAELKCVTQLAKWSSHASPYTCMGLCISNS